MKMALTFSTAISTAASGIMSRHVAVKKQNGVFTAINDIVHHIKYSHEHQSETAL